jgi:hypothetical protein
MEDPGRGTYETTLGVVPYIAVEAGAHGVVGRRAGAFEIALLERYLCYVAVVQRASGLAQYLFGGGLEV